MRDDTWGGGQRKGSGEKGGLAWGRRGKISVGYGKLAREIVASNRNSITVISVRNLPSSLPLLVSSNYLVELCVVLEIIIAAVVEVVGIHVAALDRQRHGEGAHTRKHVT